MVLYIPDDNNFMSFLAAQLQYGQLSRMAIRSSKIKLVTDMLCLDEHIRRIEARIISLEQEVGDANELLAEINE